MVFASQLLGWTSALHFRGHVGSYISLLPRIYIVLCFRLPYSEIYPSNSIVVFTWWQRVKPTHKLGMGKSLMREIGRVVLIVKK